MGTTGLETAFAAIYTELVVTGELELETLIERMTAGAALYELPTPRIAPGEPANLCLVDLEQSYEVGGRRLRQPLGELLLPRADAVRARSARRSPRARSRSGRRCWPRPGALSR